MLELILTSGSSSQRPFRGRVANSCQVQVQELPFSTRACILTLNNSQLNPSNSRRVRNAEVSSVSSNKIFGLLLKWSKLKTIRVRTPVYLGAKVEPKKQSMLKREARLNEGS